MLNREIIESVEKDIPKLRSDLAEKMNKGESFSVSQIDTNKGKFDEQHMTEAFIQKIAGTTPVSLVPANLSVNNDKIPNNAISHHKLFAPQVPIITNTVQHNLITKTLKFIHPTYITLDNLIITKAINVTTQDVILDLSTLSNTIHFVVYDYFTKILTIKPITTDLTTGDKILFIYYNGKFTGYNSHLIKEKMDDIYTFKYANSILIDILENSFIANVNIKLLGDSITAGVGSTGYGLTSELIGLSTKYVPIQDSKCYANKLGQRIKKLFDGIKVIEPTNKNINYITPTSILIQKNKGCKLFARVNCLNGFNFDIKATSFSLYFTKGSGCGIIDIKVDGAIVQTIDLYNATDIFSFKADITGLTNAFHFVEVVVKGKNPSAVSNRINFEGIELTRVINYKNMGVSGVDSEWIDFYRADLINNDDDVIFIQIGTNDRLDFNDVSALSLYLSNTIEYIRTLKKDVILLSSCGAIKSMENLKFTMADVDVEIAKICDKYGITHISNYKGVNKYCLYRGVSLNSLLGDGLHPNDTGYDVKYMNVCNGIGIPTEPIES